MTTEEQIEELRGLLSRSSGHLREVVRPDVIIGENIDPVSGERIAVVGPGPVTVVTFYISDVIEEPTEPEESKLDEFHPTEPTEPTSSHAEFMKSMKIL